MSDVESDMEEVDPEVDVDEEDDDEKVVIKKPITVKKIALPEEHIDSDEEEDDDIEDDDDNNDEDEDDDFEDLEEPEAEAEAVEASEAVEAVEAIEQGPPKKDQTNISPINSDVESDDDDFLQKFDAENRNEYVKKFHPECFTGNSAEIEALTKITRDANNIIVDENHQTNPFLSKYEKTKILGQRAKQINLGHPPYITVPATIIDGYLIAELELREKKIPIIIRRPLPGGRSEYWKLADLELI